MDKVFIIAEAGVNHNGSLETAKEMIYKAKDAGVDAVKFQTFITDNLVTKNAQKAQYQKSNTGNNDSQFEMLRKLELSFADYRELQKLCNKLNIEFMSTPFDVDSIDMLMKLGVDRLKLPSGEITNYPYLVHMAKTGKPIIMSSGMCTAEEIEEALQVLRNNRAGGLSLLHCTTEYPAPYEEVNLRAMITLEKRFQLPVGYSDHTEGIEIPIAAAAIGAKIIEKHFTLDRTMKGPDHRASLEPEELKLMVNKIRHVECSLGDGIKKPSESEMKNMAIARKSIVARHNIKMGDVLTEENITTKRPGDGLSPMRWSHVIGKRAVRDFAEDEMIEV